MRIFLHSQAAECPSLLENLNIYEDIYEYIFKTNPKTLISSHQDNTVNQINARYKHAYASFIDTLEIILGA